MQTLLGRLFHILTTLLIKKNLPKSYLVQFFWSLKLLPQVITIVAILKFGTATISYLPVNILYVSIIYPVIRR